MLRNLSNAARFASNTANFRANRAAGLSGAARTSAANATGARAALRGTGAGGSVGPGNGAAQIRNVARGLNNRAYVA